MGPKTLDGPPIMGISQWARGSVHSPHMVATPLFKVQGTKVMHINIPIYFIFQLFLKQATIEMFIVNCVIFINLLFYIS